MKSRDFTKVNKKKQTNHFFLPEDQSLFDYDYIFSASALWVDLGMENVEATFDLVVRDLPKNRNFLLFAGLEEIISGILNWKFTTKDIGFLLKRKIITPKLAKLLKNFKFSGDVMAMPECTVFFPGEPVLRISGKLWEVNLFTFFLMNALSSNTIFSSKMVRGFLAAQGKIYVATCPPVRGHAHEAALKFGRIAYLFGSASGMVPGFARKFNIEYQSKARGFHAFIKSFPSELEAMRAIAKVFPNASVMIDTYDVKQGLKHAITAALENKSKGRAVFNGVFIDSGKDADDYAKQATYARRELDKAGLKEVQIIVAGNFQEYKIKELVDLKAPVDKVILGTEFIAPADDPKIEVVLKMAQFVKNGVINHTAKLAKGKVSYPGIKQVYRHFNDNRMTKDIISLETENTDGIPLLIPMIKKGKAIYRLPELDEIKDYLQSQLKTLPENLKRIDKQFSYDVTFSKGLKKLLQEIQKQH